ncbi:YcaO-like family protein [Parafrankia sp. FMc2]|uniref:YcaO-like family protein n=1 Tax=Parafrankia sp. FMc2 TaxID=3233196 RepID=UPI0034D773DA
MQSAPLQSANGAVDPAEGRTDRVVYRRGTHRALAPADTWAWLRPMLTDFGVTRVADLTGLDTIGVPVFQAVRPAARTVSVSQGKGLSADAARVSAAMEAVELWHAEQPLTGFRCTAAELDLPYPVEALHLADGSFVHPDLPLDWLPATDLGPGSGSSSGNEIGGGAGTGTAVPLALVQLDHTSRPEWDPPLFHATSNGLAGGNTVAEATAHALAELLERDSLARLRAAPAGSAGPVRARRLDLATVDAPECREVLDRFAAAGAGVEVLVVDDDPACFEARLRSAGHPAVFTGSGSHLDPAVALARALTEAAQSRLTAIAGARDDLPELLFRPRLGPPPTGATAPRAVPVGGDEPWSAVSAGDRRTSGDLAADVDRLAAAARRRGGFAPLRVVLPTPAGVPVVKVIGPGLRFDARTEVAHPGRSATGGPR